MVGICSIHGCRSDLIRKQNEKVTFHSFPKKPELAEKWIEFVKASGKPNFTLATKTRDNGPFVCSHHFLPWVLINCEVRSSVVINCLVCCIVHHKSSLHSAD